MEHGLGCSGAAVTWGEGDHHAFAVGAAQSTWVSGCQRFELLAEVLMALHVPTVVPKALVFFHLIEDFESASDGGGGTGEGLGEDGAFGF